MRPSVLPLEFRAQVISQFEQWIADRDAGGSVVLNIRDPNQAHNQIVQDLQSYVNYLKNAPDESSRLPDLVKFVKQLESRRGNSIVTCLPEYEELFRSAGY
jgi:hypothetical protein